MRAERDDQDDVFQLKIQFNTIYFISYSRCFFFSEL